MARRCWCTAADWRLVSEAARDVPEHVRIRVEDRDVAAVGEPRMVEQVAGAGTDVEVAIRDLGPVQVDQRIPRESPKEPGEDADDDRVVELEQQRAVVGLPSISRIGSIHRQPSAIKAVPSVGRMPSRVAGWQRPDG